MPRVTKSLTARAKHKKVLKATKGHYGARSRLFRTAKQSNVKALQYAFRDRRNKKEHFVLYGFLEFQQHCFLWIFLIAGLFISSMEQMLNLIGNP